MIITPPSQADKVTTLPGYLAALTEWQDTNTRSGGDDGFLSQLWYRGVNQAFEFQAPGVYRPDFTARAAMLTLRAGDELEKKRLHLEREVISQFRTAGATFLRDHSAVDIYFAAQHFGMPTRLLDWSTNPLAALFFACDGQPEQDGVVYAMDARRVIPRGAFQSPEDPLSRSVMTMRHRYVQYAVGVSFWSDLEPQEYQPYVLPVRPDIVPGRISQQGSAFTFHMHGASDVANPTMLTLSISAEEKPLLQRALHALNINQFTTYFDLDHLSKEIRIRWGIRSRFETT